MFTAFQEENFRSQMKVFYESNEKRYPEFCSYVHHNWESIASMWADFGRRFDHDRADTNNLVER